jgi:hypothetical protein
MVFSVLEVRYDGTPELSQDIVIHNSIWREFMAHPYHHALSSVKKHGGKPEDYLKIHAWFDQTKAHLADARHRAILHSSFGIFLCEQVFGFTLKNSDNKEIPVRLIGEQHVKEDMGGSIPSIQDWLLELPLRPWMAVGARGLRKSLEKVDIQEEAP